VAFVSLAWLGAALLTVVFAATSVVGDRRRGFFDLVLVTPLDAAAVVDGTLWAVWHHLRRSYWLPWSLGLLFLFTSALNPVEGFCSLLTTTLACAALAVYGVGCSLAARSLPGALVPTFLFGLLITVGTPFLTYFRDAGGPILWGLSGVGLAVATVWVGQSRSPAAVGSFLATLHLVLVTAATCWTLGDGPGGRDYPLALVNPAFWTVILLDHHGANFFRGRVAWFPALVCYWTALVVYLLWARRWLVRHFDRLTERGGTARAVSRRGGGTGG
jgi:hypothetical protein